MRKEEKTQEKLEKLESTIGKLASQEVKVKKPNKLPTFFTSEVLALLIITMIVSLLMGGLITYKLIINNSKFVDEELQEFINNYEYIIENYYDDVDKEELLDAALEGMLEILDQNSVYLEDEASDTFNKQLTGSYEGFGIEIYNDDGNIVIADVYENTSADEKGLQAGDIITKFADIQLTNVSASEFVDMVDEAGDEKIKITYSRNGEESTVTLTKTTVTLTSVYSNIINKEEEKVGYIRVSIFASNTDEQFAEQLEALEEKGIDSLIIDLRSNSGGHLSAATNMISEFLDSSHVIYQIKTKNKTTKTYSNGKETKDYKIAVLVDSSSASASEIMTSALQEQYGATVIGVKTYGKGTVQELQDLPNGDQYKFTTKEWLTSKGKTIDGKGITPDIEVSLDETYYNDPTDENDNQLQTALEELTK